MENKENKVTMDAYKMLHGCAKTIMEQQGDETAKKNPFILAVTDSENERLAVHVCASGGDALKLLEGIMESIIFNMKKEGMSEKFIVKQMSEMCARATMKAQMQAVLSKLKSGDFDIEELAKDLDIDLDDIDLDNLDNEEE